MVGMDNMHAFDPESEESLFTPEEEAPDLSRIAKSPAQDEAEGDWETPRQTSGQAG
jgi:hypothetical protein